ncbi:MAG: hypothetical protein KDD44_03240 [Bdellovibrionales bacterium]|nr:hypothetical protein [Bdellovibrionales bacterium]
MKSQRVAVSKSESSWSNRVLFVAAMLLAASISGCSLSSWVPKTEGCKIRTFVDQDLLDYVSERYHSKQSVRYAIIPFDVPETFARAGDDSHHFGRTLARLFQEEFLRSGELGTIELFNRDRWPGKRDDFFTGNYQAMEYARNAGYDMVILGHMEDIRDPEEFSVYTKVIDLSNNITIWFAKTTVYSRERTVNRLLSTTRVIPRRPEMFYFDERSAELSRCTVFELLDGEMTPPS